MWDGQQPESYLMLKLRTARRRCARSELRGVGRRCANTASGLPLAHLTTNSSALESFLCVTCALDEAAATCRRPFIATRGEMHLLSLSSPSPDAAGSGCGRGSCLTSAVWHPASLPERSLARGAKLSALDADLGCSLRAGPPFPRAAVAARARLGSSRTFSAQMHTSWNSHSTTITKASDA
eukprot:CAMPEP_0178451704 /NCGR_PEP_ID=MMETSP0689_2-20121128/43833_1 /TAXON_ID=160604 /ORGANISM="Amphidinium massartii, Strain CS-259" /LENGTH=180 /DNA_ID=CAMNT_0020077321 /DNA_START=401 /DNA_END=940 /DNA_ORIENTATION=-